MLSFLKVLPVAFMALAAVCNAATDVLSVAPVGNVAGVESNVGTGEGTRLYYQISNGNIMQMEVSGPFTRTGVKSTPPRKHVPAAQVLYGTPIAACSYDNGTIGLYEIHVFFFSPQNVLSEYYYDGATGLNGGAKCSACITQQGFAVSPGSQVLYAMENPDDNTIRVGFVSAGSPSTLSEAVRSPAGAWSVATLPNA